MYIYIYTVHVYSVYYTSVLAQSCQGDVDVRYVQFYKIDLNFEFRKSRIHKHVLILQNLSLDRAINVTAAGSRAIFLF